MNIEILGNHLLVKEKKEEVSKGGIILSEWSKTRSNVYEVVQSKSADFLVGEFVVCQHYSGDEIIYEWETFRMIREDHALAKVNFI